VISEVIRVIPQIEGVRFSAFWAKTILITDLCTVLVNAPELGSTVWAVLGFGLGVWTFT
jgi:hypothetical protein